MQGQGQHAFGIVGGGWKHDLETGDVRAERGPILRMLRPIFRADRDAQHQRHLQDPGAHRLPLGHLVKDFIAGAAHKVTIHQLGHDAPTAERITNRGADNRRFGDWRVKEAVIGQQFG